MNDQILEIIKEVGKPCAVADVAKKSGLEKAAVDKAFRVLKNECRDVLPICSIWKSVA